MQETPKILAGIKTFLVSPYRRAILAVLLLKALALWLIWALCFAHPIALSDQAMLRAWVETPASSLQPPK